MTPYNYICIEGNIGAGKTTLAHMLSERMDAELVMEEFQDNPFLPLFYSDRSKYAFHLELAFLVDRYNQLKDLNVLNVFGRPIISDYYLMKCLLFAKNNLDEQEYKLFHTFFDLVYMNIPKPDLIIYLDSSLPRLKKNIEKRNREYELNMDDQYLKDLSMRYDYFLKTTNIEVLRINTDEIDFVKNPEYVDNLVLKLSNPDIIV